MHQKVSFTPFKVEYFGTLNHFCEMSQLSLLQKKEWAQLLYTKEDLTQQAIAEKVGVAQQTISKWILNGGWEKLRTSLVRIKSHEITRLYNQLVQLNTEIEGRPEGKQYASSKEMDVIAKLTAAIKNLENEISIGQTIDVLKEYHDFVQEIDLEEAKRQISFANAFIKYKIGKKAVL